MTATFGTAQASLALALEDDNLPIASSGSYSVATAILEVTGATTLANITEGRLLDRRPTGIGVKEEIPFSDIDKHQDALTENQFQEIFINAIVDSDYTDSTNSLNMVEDVVQKALVAQVDGSFIAYDPKVEGATPDAAVRGVWSTDGDATLDSIVANRLRVNDGSAVNHLLYSRSEASLVDKAIAELRANLRVDSSGTGAIGPFAELQDATKAIRVAVLESGGQLLVGFSNAGGSAHIGTPSVVDFSTDHDIRILKIGERVAQLEIDGNLTDVVPWSSFSAAGAANTVRFGTSADVNTSDVSWGEVNYCVYPNVHSTLNIARQASVALNFAAAGTEPDNVTPAWTPNGTSTADTTTNPGHLTIADAGAGEHKNYTLAGSDLELTTEGFKKTVIFDSMVQVPSWTQSQGALDMVSFVRIRNGYKEMIVGITYDGSNSGVVVADDITFAAVLSGTSTVALTDVDWAAAGHSLRVEMVGDANQANRKLRVLVDRELQIEVDWDTMTDDTTAPDLTFGTGAAGSQGVIATVIWDSIHISKPGDNAPIEFPVHGFLATVTTSDPHPIVLLSSDNGNTWVGGNNSAVLGLDYNLLAVGGSEILAMIGLSKADELIDDYSVMYSQTQETGNGFFKYYEFTAVGGETLIPLPFAYTQGNKELEVIENGVELYDGVSRDYIETSPTSITLNTPTDPGDLYKFRVNHRIINTGAAGTQGSGRREIWQVRGGTVPPSQVVVGANLFQAEALSFDASANEDIPFQIPIPDNADIEQDILVVMKYVMDTSHGGNVKLDLGAVIADLGDDIDPAVQEVTLTSTFVPGAGVELLRTRSLTIPAAQITSNDAVLFATLERDAVTDTHTGEFQLLSLELKYGVL